MTQLAHVTVVMAHGHWSASFIESPEIATGGMSPLDAVRRLLNGHAHLEPLMRQAVEIRSGRTVNRREFVVPLVSRALG